MCFAPPGVELYKILLTLNSNDDNAVWKIIDAYHS